MKIDPLQIKTKSFSRKPLGGFNSHEVTNYLEQLSYEWSDLTLRNQELEQKLRMCNSQLQRVRELENALLKELEEIRNKKDHHLDDARKQAGHIIKSAEQRAEKMVNAAKLQAHKIVNETEFTCKNKIMAMQQQMQTMHQNYRHVDHEARKIVSDLNNFLVQSQYQVDRLSSEHEKRSVKIAGSPLMRQPGTGKKSEQAQPRKQTADDNLHRPASPSPTGQQSTTNRPQTLLDKIQAKNYGRNKPSS